MRKKLVGIPARMHLRAISKVRGEEGGRKFFDENRRQLVPIVVGSASFRLFIRSVSEGERLMCEGCIERRNGSLVSLSSCSRCAPHWRVAGEKLRLELNSYSVSPSTLSWLGAGGVG